MKFSVFFIGLITIYISLMTYSQISKPVPGCSGCLYYASTQASCNVSSVPVFDLPKECSSYFYWGITVENASTIHFGYPRINNQNYIQFMLESNMSTFLYYGYQFDEEWIAAVKNSAENAKTEMENLKIFLEPYQNISGLVLEMITPMPGTTDFDNYTENLQAYLDEMKACFPNFSIGFEINGQTLIDFQNQESPPLWLDFSLLDPIIDFYVINVNELNECTKAFEIGGAVPLTGDAFYTVDKVYGFVVQLGIPGNKTYFMYSAGPQILNKNLTNCDATSAVVCRKPSFDGFCADNTQTYYDKGKYAKQNGVGFIASDVDLLDDPYNSCQCVGPYPAFHAMLAGFKETEIPPKCPLFDKS